MTKCSCSKTVVIHLEMDGHMARWLKAIMQNPLDAQEPEEEDPHDAEMRRDLFEALRDV